MNPERCDRCAQAGSIVARRWPNVLLDQRRFVLSEAISQGRTNERVVQTPKSGKGRRAAMSERLRERLAAYYVEQVRLARPRRTRNGEGMAERSFS